MKINFNLREVQNGIKPSEQKETPINVVLRWNSQRLVRPTGKAIHPHKWNFDKQRAWRSLYDPHTWQGIEVGRFRH